METPEEGVAVEAAVEEILRHVRRDEHDQKLHDPRQRRDPRAERLPIRRIFVDDRRGRERKEADLPASVLDLTKPEWKGKVGWAPTNASFQAFVTAMRVSQGDDITKQWLEGLVANDVQTYEKNGLILDAVDTGQAQLGLVNHYY